MSNAEGIVTTQGQLRWTWVGQPSETTGIPQTGDVQDEIRR